MMLREEIKHVGVLRITPLVLVELFKNTSTELLRIIKHSIPADAEIVSVRYDELQDNIVIQLSSGEFKEDGDIHAPWVQII